jgi:hypothetical protein
MNDLLVLRATDDDLNLSGDAYSLVATNGIRYDAG